MIRTRKGHPLAPLHSAIRIACMGLALGQAGQSHALAFQPNDDLKISWDTTLTYALAWRTESRDHALSNGFPNPVIANIDDGNNAFDKGSLITNRSSFLTEANFNWKEDFGLFVRASGFYDDVYNRSNDNGTGTSNCVAGGQCSQANHFPHGTIDQHGHDLRLLDHYVYGAWDLGGHNLNLRVGDQVVSWGESLFIGNGISGAMAPVDATKANTPGVELKELFLPVGQVFGQIDLTDALSLQAYYQYEWKKTEIDGVGSFFSVSDQIDEGGFTDAFGITRRLHDDNPSDSGQYGVALNYVAESLNNTEFGLYYVRFHDKAPQIDFLTDWNTANYRVNYFEDIDLYGASFSTVVGDTNISGEVSYRDGQPVLVDTGLVPHPVRAETMQAQVSFIHSIGTTPFADNATLTGEVGYNEVLDNDKAPSFTAFVPDGLGGAFPLVTPDTDKLYFDKSSWGYTLNLSLEYLNIFNGWDLTVPLIFSQNLGGDSSIPGTFGMGEGDHRLGVGTTWRYLNNFTVEARYNAFLGDAGDTPFADRDNFGINVKYSF
ncbi:DUF1302 domain-containing protein [Metapseudomonas lalkuanensis]|uniref:DUF1302 domain-containing protein n=1 Tax=Metapseudomonas lalkuanensis TaxID=2604832 RepID=A0A5J6QLY0_9GAMM|nr:DUF1302 domain-containing protein [Pseudomonas lalkuanensis]QEY61589.1 DUF1302 domain-containing protein [Pseudomonas lalkuanensis]